MSDKTAKVLEILTSKYLRVIAKQMADIFGNPCNYSPLDEMMWGYCEDRCTSDDNVECWVRLLQKWVKEYA